MCKKDDIDIFANKKGIANTIKRLFEYIPQMKEWNAIHYAIIESNI